MFNNTETDNVASYQTLDVMVKLSPNDASWRVELIGKNITDQAGINARFTDVFGVGATGDQFIQPRHSWSVPVSTFKKQLSARLMVLCSYGALVRH